MSVINLLKTLYVDGYKCLDNISIDFSQISLLIGKNGTVKTTVFEVIHKLQKFILGKRINSEEKRHYQIKELFAEGTRSQTINYCRQQCFNLTLENSGTVYTYILNINNFFEREIERLLLGNNSIKNNWSDTTSIFVLKSYQDDSLKKFLELVSNIFCPGNTIPSNIITDHYYRSINNKYDVYENFTNWYYYLLYLHDNYKIYSSYKDNIPALEKQLQQAINGFKHILFSSIAIPKKREVQNSLVLGNREHLTGNRE
ncbi:MAG: hypothetical protein F6K40_34880 [Okeania sp. SIO3I5]|uniref:hypothetical protein n=1 Tax=Okeania sp. SIO3I5 TaxID=2607805 RepID=UPI0013B5C69E|nr:hypothetical protein [Okeania sp. SIO3I5]NEQ41117.1 hypothetical protein [Okeania sp. SIO3I5]